MKALPWIGMGLLAITLIGISWINERGAASSREKHIERLDALLEGHQFSNLVSYFERHGSSEASAIRKAEDAWHAMDMDGESILKMVESSRR